MRALSFVLSTTLALLSGCDPDPGTASPDVGTTPEPTPAADPPPAEPTSSEAAAATLAGDVCPSAQRSPSMIAGITPAEPVHYAELRRAMGNEERSVDTSESAGTACAGSSDTGTCTSALATARSEQGFGFGCPPMQCHEILVYTRGDAVEVVDTVEGLRAFLGPVDTMSEVALILRAHRYSPGTCAEAHSGGIVRTDFGWTVKASKRIADCPVEYADYELNVMTNGEVKVISETKRPNDGKVKACI